jgi:hypothetical protein
MSQSRVRVSQPGKRTARGVWPSGKRTRGSNRPLLEPDPTGLPAGSALIILERGPNAGSRFLLDQPVTSVGRHPRSDTFLDDVTVSRRHVELRWEKDDFHTSPGHSAANSVSSATAATNPPRRSRRRPSTDSGTIAEMDARSEPGLNDPFEEAIDDALSSLPADLRAAMSNVEMVVEDEPPDGQPLLGPVLRRTASAKEQHVQRSASRQDQHLRRANHATRCRRRRSSTPRGQPRRAPRDRASLRDQRRAVDRARSLLTWC